MMMIIAMVMMMKMQAHAKVHMGEMSEPPAPTLSEQDEEEDANNSVDLACDLTIMVILLLMRICPNVTIIFHKGS